MKIVIIGAGSVGYELARTISLREHDVVLVEKDAEQLAAVSEQLDCHFVCGNGVSPQVLRDVGMRDCDLFAAVTEQDEINIIACQTAHILGARVKVARVRQEDYYLDHRLLLDGITKAINPRHEAVHAIREILLQTGANEIHEFADGKVRVIGARVEEGSRVDGKTLAEIHHELGKRVALVTTIVRDGHTLVPHGQTRIQSGDQVFLAGPRSRAERSLLYFRTAERSLKRVMIVGANDIGMELTRDLLAAGVKVKLIDRDPEKCQMASEQLRDALVLNGEGSDTELLTTEGVGDMDGFVSVSAREETNIMACLLAKHYGAGKTVCLVNRTDYVPLLPVLGIDAAVSPRLSTSTSISRFVKRGAVTNAEKLGYSGAEILQLRVQPGCACLGQPLKESRFPRTAVIAAILKRGRVVTPSGTSRLEVDDEVVVFVLPESLTEVEDFFAGGEQ